MTLVFTERDLQLSIASAVNARKFDDNDRELQNCMKAVDFIIELSESYFFVEFKDPQHPQATPQARREFIISIESGDLDEDLKYKYRDSFIYEWASGRADKPIYYGNYREFLAWPLGSARIVVATATLDNSGVIA